LLTLGQTHKITRFALFDQFPYTDHMESGVLLERK
jgi:tRNA (uracil-5-)-methyltransferase